MTSAQTPHAVPEALHDSPQAILAFSLEDLTILGANEAAYDLFGRAPNSLAGIRTTDLMNAADREGAEQARRLLAAGVIDGYKGTRRFLKADGTECRANVLVRRTTRDDRRLALAVIETKTETGAAFRPPIDAGTEVVLAVTDHDWTIERISSDVTRILGHGPGTYTGSALLGLFQPRDVQNFILAVSRVAATEVQ
jgi:PAS domain S-box-containing protein